MIVIIVWLKEDHSKALWAGGRGQSCRGRDRRVTVALEEPEDNSWPLRQPEAQLKLGQQQHGSRQKSFQTLRLSPCSVQPSMVVNYFCVHLLQYIFP